MVGSRYACPDCASIAIRWQTANQIYWCKPCGAHFLRPIDKTTENPTVEITRQKDTGVVAYNIMYKTEGGTR